MYVHRTDNLRILPVTAAAILGVAGCGDAPAPGAGSAGRAPVRVIAAPLGFEPTETRIEAVGTSRALKSIELYPAASGAVVAVNFEPGQYVTQGDVLVELDSRDEKLAVELARVRLQDAERLYDRYRRSRDSGAVLPTEVDAARTQAEAARIELDRAQVALDDRTIEAPFAGHVDYTEVDPGDRITTGTLITTLDDRSTLLVSFDVPEVMVGELTADNDVSLTPWNRPETLTGEVVEVGSRIDPASRTFTARATVDNSADALRPGMSFRVTATAKGPTRRRQRDCRAVGRRRRLRVAHRVSSPNARRYASYSAGRGVRSSMRACSRATSSSSRESSACATGCRSSSISRRPRAGPRPPMRGRPRPAPTDGP